MGSSFSQKGTQLLNETEDYTEKSGSLEDWPLDGDSAFDSRTEKENELAGLCSEAVSEKQPTKKRWSKNRRSNQLTNNIQVVTRVDSTGAPVSPPKVASGYSNAAGVIVREHVPITVTDLRAKEHANLRTLILQMLFNRYKVENEGGEEGRNKLK